MCCCSHRPPLLVLIHPPLSFCHYSFHPSHLPPTFCMGFPALMILYGSAGAQESAWGSPLHQQACSMCCLRLLCDCCKEDSASTTPVMPVGKVHRIGLKYKKNRKTAYGVVRARSVLYQYRIKDLGQTLSSCSISQPALTVSLFSCITYFYFRLFSDEYKRMNVMSIKLVTFLRPRKHLDRTYFPSKQAKMGL